MKKFSQRFAVLLLSSTIIVSCKKNDDMSATTNPAAKGKDPNTAEVVSVDRFSTAAGHLQVRTSSNGLPGPNEAVNFDQGPFITTGLTPDGKSVQYYNFDVQPTTPAPIWALFKKDGTAVAGQLNIIDVIPGDAGYNDFWQVYKVTVSDDYVANTVTSYTELVKAGYAIEKTDNLVNCPVVPKGSTATKRFVNEDAGLTKGWYKDKLVYYFNFSEKALKVTGSGSVPLAPIYVTFNINPDQPNGGPASGFKTETGSDQTHNVVATVPADVAYSPLWGVIVYDNAAFSTVHDLSTATAAKILVPAAGNVNCPVVHIQ